jgi:hypothetical protein
MDGLCGQRPHATKNANGRNSPPPPPPGLSVPAKTRIAMSWRPHRCRVVAATGPERSHRDPRACVYANAVGSPSTILTVSTLTRTTWPTSRTMYCSSSARFGGGRAGGDPGLRWRLVEMIVSVIDVSAGRSGARGRGVLASRGRSGAETRITPGARLGLSRLTRGCPGSSGGWGNSGFPGWECASECATWHIDLAVTPLVRIS